MLRKFKKKAQSTAEYSILFALVIAAAVGMQDEVRRSIQGKIKAALDQHLSPAGGFMSGQYEPQRGNKSQSGTNTKNVSEIYVENKEQEIFWQKEATSNVQHSSNITQ